MREQYQISSPLKFSESKTEHSLAASAFGSASRSETCCNDTLLELGAAEESCLLGFISLLDILRKRRYERRARRGLSQINKQRSCTK